MINKTIVGYLGNTTMLSKGITTLFFELLLLVMLSALKIPHAKILYAIPSAELLVAPFLILVPNPLKGADPILTTKNS